MEGSRKRAHGAPGYLDDLLEGLTHIRVIWVSPGKNADMVTAFFDTLGAERAKRLESVAIDMSGAYIEAVREKASEARLVFDRRATAATIFLCCSGIRILLPRKLPRLHAVQAAAGHPQQVGARRRA